METVTKKASVLIEAIPYIHAFRKKVFVIKYGGSILDNDTVRRNVLTDIVFLSYVGIRTVIVHGGGPHITNRVKEKGLKSDFHNGIRITDEETLKIVSEELEKLNKKIVDEIKVLKGDVVGVKGSDNILHVVKREAEVDLGFVGTITKVDKDKLNEYLHKGHIVVLSPMGISGSNQQHNINADEVSSAIAASLEAEKLVLLTDVAGVLRDAEDPESLISTLTKSEINNLIKLNVIKKGMIPKVDSCIQALNAGVKKTHIIDARAAHGLLLEIFTNKGIGTQILQG